MKLFFERWYPVGGAVIAIVLWCYFKFEMPSNQHEIFNSSLTFGAILTGFLSTALTLLISIQDREIVKQLKESGYIKDLIRYLAQAIWFAFAFSIVSFIGLFMVQHELLAIAWICTAVGGGLSFFRVIRVTLKIIQH